MFLKHLAGCRLYIIILMLIGIGSLFPMKSQARALNTAAVSCALEVPPRVISQEGLLKTWTLRNSCSEGDPNQAVFVQAIIFNPANKAFQVYDPLVVNAGTTPAATLVPITLPAGAVVAIFGGGNDDVTTLIDPNNQCVKGAGGNVFGQVFFCNAVNFFSAVNNAGVSIHALGVDSMGNTCPTVRDFRIVDQDQSDNVQTQYLFANGQTAQDTPANRAALGNFTVMKNPSDNRLLTNFIDPAIGCTPWKVTDVTSGNTISAQALDELQAAALQSNPTALIPAGDPMVGPNNLTMLNAYRANVDQPAVDSLVHAKTNPYCGKMTDVAPGFIKTFKQQFTASASPVAGTNLYEFLLGRFQASQMILNCPGATASDG